MDRSKEQAGRQDPIQLASAGYDGYTAGHIAGFLKLLEPVELLLGFLGTRESLGIF